MIREVKRSGREWLIKFLLCRNLNALKEVPNSLRIHVCEIYFQQHINKEFKTNETINVLYFSFEEENDFIEFCFNEPCPNGWSVMPHQIPTMVSSFQINCIIWLLLQQVSQREIDDFGSMSPPNFPLRLIKITAEPGENEDLNYPVTLRGVKCETKKINIVLTTG